MRKIAALIRASWLEAISYRLKTAIGFVSLIVSVVPLYYIARGLQPVMGDSIQSQGGDYFGFLVVGTAAFACMRISVGALPGEIGGAISSGTMEALLGTPTRMPVLLAGMAGYAFSWTGVRVAVFVTFGWLLGAPLIWSRTPLALVILLLIAVAYLSFGLFASALVLAFRTPGPLPNGIIWVSTILGGVYYPTEVIPPWLEQVSRFVPLAYGARPLRRAWLEPSVTSAALTADLVPLAAMAVVLFGTGLLAFAGALRYARRSGTLSQY